MDSDTETLTALGTEEERHPTVSGYNSNITIDTEMDNNLTALEEESHQTGYNSEITIDTVIFERQERKKKEKKISATDKFINKIVNTSLAIRKANAEKSREQFLLRKKASQLLKENLMEKKKKSITSQQASTSQQSIQEQRQNLENQQNQERSRINELDSDLGPSLPYTDFLIYQRAHEAFKNKFTCNSFGHICSVCDRLWFQQDLKTPSHKHENMLKLIIPNKRIEETKLCSSCIQALNKDNIPVMSTHNGFRFPEVPNNLPPLDLVSERLVSPRIPFMQIRRLRHVNGQYGIYGQIINVPVSVNNMVKSLPRNIDDDYCINVHIKRKKIHKSSFLNGIVNKRTIKAWLRFLISSPLYTLYDIQIEESFFEDQIDEEMLIGDVSEHIPIEESLTAQQHTLLWNEEQYLRIAPGEENVPQSLLFDEHAEELSFPSIYLGQFRNFRDGVRVTPFMMASSELRRSDRRAVSPYHLLYMAMKIMRIRVRDSLTVAFKYVGKNTQITRKQIDDGQYINNCIETNLAFLRSIPNSTWYWMIRKKDLFAMIRQFGKPTIFLTVSANEIGWTDLLQILYKYKHNGGTISEEDLELMHYIEKTTLVNDDAVICAIYFHKLINVLLNILVSPKFSPFGHNYVVHYFKRIEFQHRGSPHAHILLWLADSPIDALDKNKLDAILLIDRLISVSSQESSGNIKLQTHKHTFTCYKKILSNKRQECRFEAPFMPSRSTTILTPMQKDDPEFKKYAQRYKQIRINLENNDYCDFDSFYQCNNISSDEDYLRILQAGIKRPRVFLKRYPFEKWNNPFNPFILNIVKSNMDIQFITEEYSCAQYVAEYVNKTDRGVSHLQREIIKIMDKHPEFDVFEITRKMGVNILNSVEITSQEAAWYLLREPMSKCSTVVTTIPTMWPLDRQRIRKTQKELDELAVEEYSTNIWKENWFDKYERRHQELEDVTLAQFVANYTSKPNGTYTKRKEPRVIRYRNYDIGQELNDYKREMVTLHFPFRNEDDQILAEMKFIEIYNSNENLILNRRKEFESNLDIQKTMEICRNLCQIDGFEAETEVLPSNSSNETNPFQELYDNPISDMNSDLQLALLNKLGPIAKKRENLMPNSEFCELMRMANEKQKELLLHVISKLLTPNSNELQIFFTGPAGCGKTFVIKLLMEIYNRYSDNDGFCNSYISCASTGKAAVAIDGTTVHTALRITLSKLLPLNTEVAHQYRALFKYVKVIIVDEVSMIGAELLNQIDSRLKQITGNFQKNFGGLDIILIGDLRQLPPVRATPIYKQHKQRIIGPILWRGLKFFELEQVMRQSNQQFSSMLTKIGNGDQLDENQLALLESRFLTSEEARIICPHGIRLFCTNEAVTKYNNTILSAAEEKTNSIANDIFIGCTSTEQTTFLRQKLHKMSLIDTGGLPYETVFVKNIFYMITTNIDVADGLANGAVGKLVHIDHDDNGELSVVWLVFPNSSRIGSKIRKKIAAHLAAKQIDKTAVPIGRRSSTIPLNNNKTIHVKRSHFPLICACATTIHKSQGSTYPEIVYEYSKKHVLSLVYVALTRVTSLQGLYITTNDNDKTFYHGRRPSTSIASLQTEFQRLSQNRLKTISSDLIEFIGKTKGISTYSFNCQSLRAHSIDITDSIAQNSNILLLNETWLGDEEPINIENFNCITKYKRPNVRAGGVAIFHNKHDTSNVVIPRLDLTMKQSERISRAPATTAVGEFCVAESIMENNKKILLIAVYISPNQNIEDIINFFRFSLMPLRRDDKLPIILAGDFNVNFSAENSKPIIRYFNNIDFFMNNDRTSPTTKYGTSIDAVFVRH